MTYSNRVELNGYIKLYHLSEDGYITFSLEVEKRLNGKPRKFTIDCYANKLYKDSIVFYKNKNSKVQIIGHLNKFKCHDIFQQWVVVDRIGSR